MFLVGCVRRFLLVLVTCLMSLPAAADLVRPDPSIAPIEVVAIQLKALQYNDNPSPDFGIAQTWSFAHPRNRSVTGPLPRFAMMIKSPAYGSMLNHRRHEITVVAENATMARYDVLLETDKGQILLFQWGVEKVADGEFADCWMTTIVSAPRLAGQGS